MRLTRYVGLVALSLTSLSCASEGPPLPSSSTDMQSGKLIDIVLYDVVNDVPVFDSDHLSAEYTVLAAMPDSGPVDATYSIVFDVNRIRVSVTNIEPYYLTSSKPGVASAWNSGPGKFEISATAYSGKDGQGDVVGRRTTTMEIKRASN